MSKYAIYRYTKDTDPVLDADFSAASAYSKVKPGQTALFWKSGLRWYSIPYSQIRRIYRRVEAVYGKLCCGGKSFIIEWLVLVLSDGSELVIHIGDEVPRKAQELLEKCQSLHPELLYGKP